MSLASLGFLLLLAIPFHPFWLDFELARRGILLITAGMLLFRAPQWWPAKLPSGSLLFAALTALLLLRSFHTINPMDGLYRGLHLCALWLIMIWGSTQKIDGIIRASLAVTLLLTCYGLLQAFGLVWPQGYAQSQSVSTLGNRNVASEVLTMGAALAALHCARLPRPTLAVITLALTICYLSLNGSRSALLALPPACMLILLGAPRRRPLLLGIALGVMLGAGSLWLEQRAGEPGSQVADLGSPPSTIEVRLEIWQSCWQLLQEGMLLGQGSGEFRHQYPRVRSQREIEISSFGRRFHTGVDTAHNDSIEIAVEAGLLGLFTWIGFWLLSLAGIMRHDERGLSRLAPLIAFLALSLTRSPLGNAPAAGIAFLFLGSVLRRREINRDWVAHWHPSRWLCMTLGLCLIALGSRPLLSQTRAAAYLSSLRDGNTDPSLLDQAIWWNGGDSSLRQLRIQNRRHDLDPKAALAASQADLEFLIRHAPHNTTALLLVAETLHGAGESDQANRYLAHLLALDPRDPEAVLMLATIRSAGNQAATAVAVLYADPHPSLRVDLPRHLSELAKLARARGDYQGADLLVREQFFMRALLALERDPRSADAASAVRAFHLLVSADEPRGLVLAASLALAAGEQMTADALGQQALAGRRLSGASTRLMQKLIFGLGELESWARYLDLGRGTG